MAEHFHWALPAVVDPPERLCAVVSVPNDQNHIAAFLGALYALAWQQNWRRDSAHSAKDVAAVWLSIWEQISIGDCLRVNGGDDVQFRQNGCKLEFSIDCVHWQTLYDPTDCIAGIAGQPSGGGALQAGECRGYDVTLQGNGRWLLPVPVSEGYTVEVTGARGGWYDGAEVTWRCPDGRGYLFATCSGGTTTESGDPLNTSPHMALLAKLEDATPVFTEILTGPYTVGSGVADLNLSFQANDSDLTDNAGSASFHVKVCAPSAATWCEDFDFLTADQDWTAFPTLNPSAWVVGEGWHATYPGSGPGDDGIWVRSPVFPARILSSVTFEFDSTWSGTNPRLYLFNGDETLLYAYDDTTGVTTVTFSAGGVLATQVLCIADPFVGSKEAMSQKLIRIRLEGTGNNPFGADNCP